MDNFNSESTYRNEPICKVCRRILSSLVRSILENPTGWMDFQKGFMCNGVGPVLLDWQQNNGKETIKGLICLRNPAQKHPTWTMFWSIIRSIRVLGFRSKRRSQTDPSSSFIHLSCQCRTWDGDQVRWFGDPLCRCMLVLKTNTIRNFFFSKNLNT